VKLDSARALKRSLLAAPGFRRSGPYRAGPSPVVLASFDPALGQPLPVALGIAGTARSFRLAVRVHTPFPGIAAWLDRIRGAARGEVDVRIVGPVRAQRLPWRQARVRPLALGTSVGHARVTAGTLGAIVFAKGAWFLLSNDHVLADEDRAQKGDAVLQPGRADGGRAPDDVVARYERAVRLKKTGNFVDAALARIEPDMTFEATRVRGLGVLGAARVEPLRPGDPVAKLGRTTGLTRGVVSAIEVDRVIVGYDRGELRFDDQVEISPAGRMPFSRGGDSGSLIVDGDRRPAALLFAGNDADTTYANPLPAVLAALKVEFAEAGPAHHAAAKARARTLFAKHGEVAGIGVTTLRGRPALKVNFTRTPRARAKMPKEVLGLPVVVAVVGEVKKQEA
jgi:hypothetical protein